MGEVVPKMARRRSSDAGQSEGGELDAHCGQRGVLRCVRLQFLLQKFVLFYVCPHGNGEVNCVRTSFMDDPLLL